jgi:hypothetical protein
MTRFTLFSLYLLFASSAAQAQLGPAMFFRPDYAFEGSQLVGWHPLGPADWRAEDGVLIGTARPGSHGGWLLFEKAFQDVAFATRFRCAGTCDAGVLFRAEQTNEGMQGVLVSLRGTTVVPERVTLDREGRVLTRETITIPGEGLLPPPTLTFHPNEWTSIEIFLRENGISEHVNGEWNFVIGPEQGGALPVRDLPPPPGAIGEMVPVDTTRHGFGPLAIYVGSGSVQFDDVAMLDLLRVVREPEQGSSRFRVQRVADFDYAWGADAADIDRDGILDLIAGPFYYLGPELMTRHEFFSARTFNPSREYPTNMLALAGDWTGDGWADVVVSEMRPLVLYVNPAGESRRWNRQVVVPDACSEIVVRGDVDSDGKTELVYVDDQGRAAYAEPDPAHPIGPWLLRKVSDSVGAALGCSVHGVGVGDINGDGRPDIVQTRGWWEQPASNPAGGAWTYHEALFGRSAATYDGGGEISVYDFNGDGLNDVVGSLHAHFLGLAWWEQKRDAVGKISFERHHIMDSFATVNAGGVTFSQPHAGAVLADLDRDGVMDFVSGKRHWAHLDGGDPDPDGEAVIYGYRTVRTPGVPGGVVFEPELIHNRSGVGSELKAVDINRDGAVDLVSAGSYGTFVFWGVP